VTGSVIATPRLHLAPLTVADVSDAYVGWLNDPAINQYLETRLSPQDHASCAAFVAATAADPQSHLFKIVRQDSKAHIGNIKIGPVNAHHGAGALSLLIGDKASHGQGYATEAIAAVTDWAFGTLGLHRVEAGCYDANLGSLRAFLKAGYVVEGFFRQARVDAEGRRVGMFWMARLNDA
jgi:RimJ/RimL family protein N-acetyltransferase